MLLNKGIEFVDNSEYWGYNSVAIDIIDKLNLSGD